VNCEGVLREEVLDIVLEGFSVLFFLALFHGLDKASLLGLDQQQ
jgi:hypothetical protein